MWISHHFHASHTQYLGIYRTECGKSPRSRLKHRIGNIKWKWWIYLCNFLSSLFHNIFICIGSMCVSHLNEHANSHPFTPSSNSFNFRHFQWFFHHEQKERRKAKSPQKRESIRLIVNRKSNHCECWRRRRRRHDKRSTTSLQPHEVNRKLFSNWHMFSNYSQNDIAKLYSRSFS